MAEILKIVASAEWIVLGVIFFVGLKRWNEKLNDAHEELLKTIRESED